MARKYHDESAALDQTSESVLNLAELEQLKPQDFNSIDPEIYADFYLHSCYPEIPFHDEKLILDFLVSEAKKISPVSEMLDIGCGPVISHCLPFAEKVNRFIMSDYLEANLKHIDRWIRRDGEFHNWSLHTSYILRKEDNRVTKKLIQDREDTLRSKVHALSVGDLLSLRPLRQAVSYPIVNCFYATEQAARDQLEWLDVMINLGTLVKAGGKLFLGCIHEGDFYAIHDKDRKALRIPIAHVTEQLIHKALDKSGFLQKDRRVLIKNVRGLEEEGINSIALISATKCE